MSQLTRKLLFGTCSPKWPNESLIDLLPLHFFLLCRKHGFSKCVTKSDCGWWRVNLACVASVSMGFPRKFLCFGRAKTGARAKKKKKEEGERRKSHHSVNISSINVKSQAIGSLYSEAVTVEWIERNRGWPTGIMLCWESYAYQWSEVTLLNILVSSEITDVPGAIVVHIIWTSLI